MLKLRAIAAFAAWGFFMMEMNRAHWEFFWVPAVGFVLTVPPAPRPP